jgi:hypothetical protein
MTPDKQAAPSEWVERAMEVADDLAVVARADEDQRPAMEVLRAHLESRQALVKQLAEACKVAFDQTCSVGRPKDWEQLRAALAAYQEKT